jgi:hypothetical protein
VFDNWIDILIRGSYDVGVPDLTISQGEAARFHGSGHLIWEADAGVCVHASTSGAQQLMNTFGRAPLPGMLLPREDYASLSGTTEYGWRVEATPVPLDGYHLEEASPHVVWNFGVTGITLTHIIESYGPEQRVVRAVLGPSPPIWVRPSDTGAANDFFTRRSSALDWLLAPTSFGGVGAMKCTEQWFEVKVVIDRPPPKTDASELLTAITRAFSFAFGRLLACRGHVDFAPNHESRHLSSVRRPATRNHVPEPLGCSVAREAYSRNIEGLLGMAIDFFLTDLGSQVAPHLVLCWDTADSDYRTRLAVVSVCLEGLVHIASPTTQHHDAGHTPEDRMALHDWLKANEGKLSDRFFARLNGFLKTLDHRRPVDILRSWERRGVLGITRDDVDAWQETRNAATHGRLIFWPTDRDELQRRVTRLTRVYNVINRIVLQLMGYRGSYVDYSSPGWPEVDFPIAPTEAL